MNKKEYRLQLIGTIGLDIWLNAKSEAHAEELKEQVLKTINDQITIDCGKVFEKGKYQKTRTTCSRSCGCKLGAIHRNEKMSKRRAENAKYKSQEIK